MEADKLKATLVRRLKKFDWVTHADRLEIGEKLGVSRQTIDNYIKGKVSKLSFAEKLIKILGKVPEARKRRTKPPTLSQSMD
jgi:transcriptional regulator with XRE-family HTH domain